MAIQNNNPIQGFDEVQLFEFDLTGFTVLPGFISSENVAKMNSIIDQTQKGEHWIKFSFLDLDPIFFDLMSNQRIMNICEELMGPWFRLDNAWGVQEVPPYTGKAPEGLHAGPMANQRSFFYNWYNSKPYCAQVNFAYALADVNLGDGGLVLLPGSHKLNLPYEGAEVFQKILKGKLEAWWLAEPEIKAGDLLIFNEAVIHGTKPWVPKNKMRRNLYYKYCPGYMVWTKYEQIKKYLAKARNDLERNLLREAYVGHYDDSIKPVWPNDWKAPTLAKPKSNKPIDKLKKLFRSKS